MHYPALHHWQNFCTNWTTFDGVFHKKPTQKLSKVIAKLAFEGL